MLDTSVAWLVNQGMNYLHSGQAERLGNAHPNIVPYQVFKTADGHIVLAIGNDSQFRTFCDFAGAPEFAADPRFATNDARVKNRAEAAAKVQEIIAGHPSQYWLDELEKLKIGCGPINTLDQVFTDPHVLARKMTVDVPHPLLSGGAKLIASPLRLSETPVEYRHHPPLLGEHTDEVLAEKLGLDAASVAELRAAGAIG
jgi:crotonobetainyl-CoA:carnitine CoA-transferase CaiB-like acyl-CoA transferase